MNRFEIKKRDFVFLFDNRLIARRFFQNPLVRSISSEEELEERFNNDYGETFRGFDERDDFYNRAESYEDEFLNERRNDGLSKVNFFFKKNVFVNVLNLLSGYSIMKEVEGEFEIGLFESCVFFMNIESEFMNFRNVIVVDEMFLKKNGFLKDHRWEKAILVKSEFKKSNMESSVIEKINHPKFYKNDQCIVKVRNWLVSVDVNVPEINLCDEFYHFASYLWYIVLENWGHLDYLNFIIIQRDGVNKKIEQVYYKTRKFMYVYFLELDEKLEPLNMFIKSLGLLGLRLFFQVVSIFDTATDKEICTWIFWTEDTSQKIKTHYRLQNLKESKYIVRRNYTYSISGFMLDTPLIFQYLKNDNVDGIWSAAGSHLRLNIMDYCDLSSLKTKLPQVDLFFLILFYKNKKRILTSFLRKVIERKYAFTVDEEGYLNNPVVKKIADHFYENYSRYVMVRKLKKTNKIFQFKNDILYIKLFSSRHVWNLLL